eukprot:scaffold561_cov162-Amphora_coffeaeformis.AAC.17
MGDDNPNDKDDNYFSIEIVTEAPNNLSQLVQLVNDVYDEAEAGMWQQRGVRTHEEELRGLIEDQRLIVAQRRNCWVGCVKVDTCENKTAGEFGMLVVDPQFRGQGVGGRLISAAETWARQRGYHVMQLELLTPRSWKQPSKEFNQQWYTRLGYVPRKTEPFERDYPHLINLLATECDFTIWTKSLVPLQRMQGGTSPLGHNLKTRVTSSGRAPIDRTSTTTQQPDFLEKAQGIATYTIAATGTDSLHGRSRRQCAMLQRYIRAEATVQVLGSHTRHLSLNRYYHSADWSTLAG